MMDVARTCTLKQMSAALYAVGGQCHARGPIQRSPNDVRGEEYSDLCLGLRTRRDAEGQLHELVFVADYVAIVEVDDHDHRRRSDALVSVDERVVLCEVEQAAAISARVPCRYPSPNEDEERSRFLELLDEQTADGDFAYGIVYHRISARRPRGR